MNVYPLVNVQWRLPEVHLRPVKDAQFGLHDEFNLRVCLSLINGMLKGLKVIKLVNDGDLTGILGKGYSLFQGRVSASHHNHFLAGEKITITGCTIRDSLSLEVLPHRVYPTGRGLPPGDRITVLPLNSLPSSSKTCLISPSSS